MTPVISIIVAVYKAESCLRRCVDSLLAQTFQDYEILLVDDDFLVRTFLSRLTNWNAHG